MTLEGLSGGAKSSDYTNNDNSNSNGKGKKQKTEKLDILVYKYSAKGKKPLHEAILLSGEPFFIAYEPDKKYIGCIRNVEEAKRILRPPDESEYPYEPIEFESLSEIKRYTELALNETIDSLYQQAKNKVVLYVEQEEEIIILSSSDIIWTWFQDLYPTTHYYDVNGKENGIGKSTIGHVFEGIAYRPARMVDPSSPNLFRALGQIEPGQCIIIADEADRMHQDKDALSILKEGNQNRSRVPKTNTNTLKQEWFFAYCFKIRIAEESLRGNITKGVIDRCFSIKAIKGKPKYYIKEVLNPACRIERFRKLHDEMNHFRKLMLCYRLIHYNDKQPDIDDEIEGLDGREMELCKPLLQLFHGSQSYKEVKDTIMTFLDRKRRHKKSTNIEPLLFEIVLEMIELNDYDTMLLVSNIWKQIRDKIDGEYSPSKPNEYQTFDYDTIYRNTITKTIEGFGAEHEKIHAGRVLIFNPSLMLRTSKQYSISEDAQEGLKRIQSVTAARSNNTSLEGAATPSRGQNDENITDSTGSNKDITKESEQKKEKEGRDGVTACQNTACAVTGQEDPNGGNYERKGMTGNIFRCLDCELESFQYVIENHKCVAWPEKKQQPQQQEQTKVKLDSGKWLLDK